MDAECQAQLSGAAIEHHRCPMPARIAVRPTKSSPNRRRLASADSPGGALAYMAIHPDAHWVSRLISCAQADIKTQRDATLVASTGLRHGDAEGMNCGVSGAYAQGRKAITGAVGLHEDVSILDTLNVTITPEWSLFIRDVPMSLNPHRGHVAEILLLAAVGRFGVKYRMAPVSQLRFETAKSPSARKMGEAMRMLWHGALELDLDGNVRGDRLSSRAVRDRTFPDSRTTDDGNSLVMPDLDAVNVALSHPRVISGHGMEVGPILREPTAPLRTLAPSTTIQGMLSLTALTAMEDGVRAA
jgi:malate dehydrogenase (oxaloacetate-decarboxylating)(NADP+)